MYTVRDVLDKIGVHTLTFDMNLSNDIARDMFTNGIYGGVCNGSEVVLAVPLRDNIKYLMSAISQTDTYCIRFTVNSSSFQRLQQDPMTDKHIHKEYKHQLAINSIEPDMIVVPDNQGNNPNSMFGIKCTPTSYSMRHSSDFPSIKMERTDKELSVLRAVYSNELPTTLTENKKKEIVRKMACIGIRRSRLIQDGPEDCDFMVMDYENKPYVIIKNDEGINVYAIVEDSSFNITLLDTKQFGLSILQDLAKKEFKK